MPAAVGQPLRRPQVLDSRDGRLRADLVAAPGAVIAGHRGAGLGFNGESPGPTLRVRPGDVLTLRLTNRLGTPTNLHTHGLRVSPNGNSDNPFVRIEPGASFEYRMELPADHPTGTFWYHPHHHGTAADQQFGGLFGALLVVPRHAPAEPDPADDDCVLLVSDITLLRDGSAASADPTARALGREGDLLLVNGQYRPTLPAAAGSTIRWRIINACTSRVLALRLDGHRVSQIALDGSALPEPVEREAVLLAPGNRMDLRVRPDRAGTFDLVAGRYDRGGIGTHGTARSPVVLASLVVTGPANQRPPVRAVERPGPVAALPQSSGRHRNIAFTMRMDGRQMTFDLDRRAFDHRRDDQIVPLGSVESWMLINEGPMDHPFHLHTWPFYVISSSDGSPPAGVLQDVVLVPARGWTLLLVPFTAHPGRAVYHCHIVDHSDAGMMATINVVS